MTWCKRPQTAVMTVPEHMWVRKHHAWLEGKEEDENGPHADRAHFTHSPILRQDWGGVG